MPTLPGQAAGEVVGGHVAGSSRSDSAAHANAPFGVVVLLMTMARTVDGCQTVPPRGVGTWSAFSFRAIRGPAEVPVEVRGGLPPFRAGKVEGARPRQRLAPPHRRCARTNGLADTGDNTVLFCAI
jgi:hypothetical protein